MSFPFTNIVYHSTLSDNGIQPNIDCEPNYEFNLYVDVDAKLSREISSLGYAEHFIEVMITIR